MSRLLTSSRRFGDWSSGPARRRIGRIPTYYVLTICLTPPDTVHTIYRMVTWDESKRRHNLRDHGIDLAMYTPVFHGFHGPFITEDDAREAYGELRIDLGFPQWRCRQPD